MTISLPDDVAATLAGLPARRVSAYVAEALRQRHERDAMREILTAAGHQPGPLDPDGAAQRLAALRPAPDVVTAAQAALRAEGIYP